MTADFRSTGLLRVVMNRRRGCVQVGRAERDRRVGRLCLASGPRGGRARDGLGPAEKLKRKRKPEPSPTFGGSKELNCFQLKRAARASASIRRRPGSGASPATPPELINQANLLLLKSAPEPPLVSIHFIRRRPRRRPLICRPRGSTSVRRRLSRAGPLIEHLASSGCGRQILSLARPGRRGRPLVRPRRSAGRPAGWPESARNRPPPTRRNNGSRRAPL